MGEHPVILTLLFLVIIPVWLYVVSRLVSAAWWRSKYEAFKRRFG